jgi:cold shock CspA family protein
MFSFPQTPPAAAFMLPGQGVVAAAGAAAPGTELPTNQPIPGKIKAWYEDKSFGFVTPDIPGPDVFVHKNQLTDAIQLTQGSPVSFQCRYNPARGKYEVTTCQSAGIAPDVAAAAVAAALGAGRASVPAKGGWAVQDNLFIAGLPMTTTEEFVRDFFAKFGAIQQCKVLPDQPGKLDKAVLVRFADEKQAKWLVENLNGTTPEGLSQPLTVRFAGDRPGGLPALPPAAATPGQSAASFGPAGAAAAPVGHHFSPYGVGSPVVGADTMAALGQLIPGLMQPQMQPQMFPGLQTMGNLGQMPAQATFPGFGGTQAFGDMGALGTTAPGLGQAGAQTQVQATSTDAAASASTQVGAEEWLQATDPATGRPYYYHAVTREVRWDNPTS